MHDELQGKGGMMALPDAYCLFNRARGTSLVSPDDLFAACSMMDKMSLAVRMRRLDSGVYVLELGMLLMCNV